MRFSIRMASRRAEDPPLPARRRQALTPLPPPAGPQPSTRDLLLRSWPGRLFIVAFAIRLILAGLRLFGELPLFLQVLSTTATIALAIALGYFVARLLVLVKRQLLWRVRRRLILSYIFIGAVPLLLIVGFVLLGVTVVSWSMAAYLFKDGYLDVVRNATAVADAAAAEIARSPGDIRGTITRVQQNAAAALEHTTLSLEFIPRSAEPASRLVAGDWEHMAPPDTIPDWVRRSTQGFTGSIAIPHPDRPDRLELVVRAVRPAATGKGLLGYVVVDIPVDDRIIDAIHERNSVKGGAVRTGSTGQTAESISTLAGTDQVDQDGGSVVFFDVSDWQTGESRRAAVSLSYQIGDVYSRIAEAQFVQVGEGKFWDAFLTVVLLVAVLFLIIEAAALTMGLALARSITSSIHELFMGTERVRQGDFTHRIKIQTKDQLGELADSFNQMTGSIENLLQTAAEKKRLEEELRIARQIQMSLLPRGPLEVPGLAVTALCVPAREVGGDYYDFFPLATDRLGVLIADVSGKGTSAALYMAELKGLVLSLSQIYQSPRELLIEVNRIISENLDTRSFITMTYAVLDIAGGVMTFARAGHTPLIHLSAAGSPSGSARILTPSGMVVGLRIDGAAEKFVELLDEEQIALEPGDFVVLYTDGITEAMNQASDLFGEARLSRIVEEHGHLASGELRERILREIEAFVGSADQHDDMTMILIKVEAAEAARIAV
jgi:sigma-B regulation protein RsbU (phosphoserine phosphatase)